MAWLTKEIVADLPMAYLFVLVGQGTPHLWLYTASSCYAFCMEKRSKIFLTHEQLVLVSMIMSREIIEYRNAPYSGAQMYVQNCKDVRKKVKDALKSHNADSVPNTPQRA